MTSRIIQRSLLCLVLCMSMAPLVARGQPRQPATQPGYIINGWYHRPGCACNICTDLRSRNQPKGTPTKNKVQPPPKSKKNKEPPPAPVEPDTKTKRGNTTPTIKIDTKGASTKATPSKAEIIKSIKDSPNLPADVRRDILASLEQGGGATTPSLEPPEELFREFLRIPKESPKIPILLPRFEIVSMESTLRRTAPRILVTQTAEKFDLLKALRARNNSPEVKTDSDDTAKPAAPPRPRPKNGKTNSKTKSNGNGYETPDTDIGVTIGARVRTSESWDTSKPVPYGKLVQFWVKPAGKKPDKLKSVAYTWTVLPKEEIILWPDTARIIFSTGIRHQTYVVMLTASYVFMDGDKIIQKTAQAVAPLTVGEPAKGRAGTPGTTGTAPPQLTGLAKRAYDWTALVTIDSNYATANMRADSLKLAAAFARIAKRIEDGHLTDINDIIRESKAENDKSLVDARTNWLPWFTSMTSMLRDAYRDNLIRTPAQYAAAWRDVAKGLQAAGR